MKNTAIWILVAVAVLGASLAAVWVLRPGEGTATSAASPIERAPPSSGVGQAQNIAAASEDPHEVGPTENAPEEVAEVTAGVDLAEQTQGDVRSTTSAETAPGQQAVTGMVAEVAIEELIENGDTYEGREVLVKGTIITQCMRGCKFAIDDGTGVINVELVGKALDRLISQGSVGKQARARGVFHQAPRPLVAVEKPENWDFLK